MKKWRLRVVKETLRDPSASERQSQHSEPCFLIVGQSCEDPPQLSSKFCVSVQATQFQMIHCWPSVSTLSVFPQDVLLTLSWAELPHMISM